jgi:hypothetical protein
MYVIIPMVKMAFNINFYMYFLPCQLETNCTYEFSIEGSLALKAIHVIVEM